MRGFFITFEGADGAGKSTQAELLRGEFERMGKDVLLTREPGGTYIGEQIRSIIIDKSNSEMCHITELLLYAAARAQIVSEVIRPALEKGGIVICDRYIDSTAAYQAYARGLPLETVNLLNSLAANAYIPDAAFFLDIPPAIAAERMRAACKKTDRLEAEGLAFQEKVYAGYKEIAKTRDNFYTVDATGCSGDIHQKILEILQGVLP